MKKQKRAIKQKLLVSETCKLELKGMCESGERWAEVPELFCQVLEEDDSVKQCALLKKAAGILLQFTDHNKQGIPHEDYRKFLAFLAEVFVACNVKNPSRRIVASIFNSSPRVKYSFDVLCSVVFKKLSSTMEMMEVGKEVFARSDIDMIVDILELFTLGTDVLRCNGHFVVAFLGMCLNKQWKAARAELTPTLQTTCMLDCLATIKTTISYLQKLRTEDSLPHVFDQLTFSSFKNQTIADKKACNNVAGSKAVKPLTDLLMDLLLDLSSLMCDELFFMDCRSTAGMAILVVLNILCSAENFVTTVGQLIFPSRVPHGEIRFSILGNLKKMPAFQCSQDEVSFSHLCLCNGVLTMVSPQALIQSTEIIVNGKLTNGTLMFDALFPDLCCLCDRLKDSSSCLFAFRTLTLWASQARQIASTGRYDSSWLKDKLNGTSPIPTKLLSYVWSHWDHPIEGVRYQTKVICEHVVNLHLIVSQNDSHKEAFLKDLTESLLKVGWHVRGKYAALCCIASVVGAKKILLWFPTVPQEIYPLMRDRCLVPHVMDLVEKMANCHKQELKDAGEDVEAWEKTWMAPLLYHVHHGCKLMREHVAQSFDNLRTKQKHFLASRFYNEDSTRPCATNRSQSRTDGKNLLSSVAPACSEA